MRLLTSLLLGSPSVFALAGGAAAADRPVGAAAPIAYVRVCSAYGAGFFFIPGADTCLRISGRARFEGGYITSYTRQAGSNGGDTSGYRGLLRFNLDARTQTAYGTLRAFVRLEAGSRSGAAGVGRSGTQERIGSAYVATGVDQAGRVQQVVNVDKAFIQFAGLTAGRASSFYDFYAHDFEMYGATSGSDNSSTNLLAYTATLSNGVTATLSVEDPVFTRSPVFSPTATAVAPVFVGYTGGRPSRYGNVDAVQRSRLPDFVGALRVDQAWGSAQISAATHEINVGNLSTNPAAGAGGVLTGIRHANSVQGWGVQGGVKINLPAIAPGDTLYLQGAYANGAQSYAGYCMVAGCYAQSNTGFDTQKFEQYFADASVNPFTGQLQTSTSFSAVASYLHYWSPEWRSALFGSYGEQDFSASARLAQGALFSLVNPSGNSFGTNGVGVPGTRFYQLSQALRDTYQYVVGGSLIWSPVLDLDIGVEAFYTQMGVRNGRVIDLDKGPGAYANVAAINAGTFVPRTATQDSMTHVRFRVQRDF